MCTSARGTRGSGLGAQKSRSHIPFGRPAFGASGGDGGWRTRCSWLSSNRLNSLAYRRIDEPLSQLERNRGNPMRKNMIHRRAALFVAMLLATAGCQSTRNFIPGFGWRTRPATSVASSTPTTSTAMSQPIVASANSTGEGDADSAAPREKDPLYGYYPNDEAVAGTSAGGAASPGWSSDPGSSRPTRGTDSFTSSSSGSCSSGCCSR